MAFLDPLLNLLPFGRNPDTTKRAREVQPPADQRPKGQSGRVNFGGFIQFDETNAKLVGSFGLKLFDEMYREDPDIRRNTAALWTPIQAANWTVEPHGGDEAKDVDRAAAQLCQWAVFENMSPNYHAHLTTLGPILIRSGFSPFEQIWMKARFEGKDVVVPRKLDLRLPRTIWRWFQDDNGDLVSVEQFLPNASNVNIPASELTYYRLQPEGDNWTGTSLLRQAYKPWFYKTHFERIDAIGQERKAVGVPIVYPPESAPPETREEMEKILANLHVNEVGYIMAPGPKAGTSGVDSSEGWTIEVITFDSSSGETIQSSISMQKQAIASAFLADFLELGHHQVGARATAQVQEDPFLTAVTALAGEIKGPGDRLLERIAALNFPNLEGFPKFKFAISDAASLSEISTYAAALIAAGAMQVDPELEDYFRERADFPAANPEVRAAAERKQKLAEEAAERALLNPPASNAPPADVDPATGERATEVTGKPKNVAPTGSPVKDKGVPGGPGTPAGSPPKRTLDAPAEDPSPDKGKITLPVPADGPMAGDMVPDEVKDGEGSSKWWEQMLSQHQLVSALDGARDQMQTAAQAVGTAFVRQQVLRGKSGRALSPNAPGDLVAALAAEIHRLQTIGYETVQEELGAQRGGTAGGSEAAKRAALLALLARARRRARTAAAYIVIEINRAVERGVTAGTLDERAIQAAATASLLAALRREAISNVSEALNEGRRSAAGVEGAIGGIYTSVLDQSTCDNCEIADDGIVRELGDPALETPNPLCDGGERCRCFVVYVYSTEGVGGQG